MTHATFEKAVGGEGERGRASRIVAECHRQMMALHVDGDLGAVAELQADIEIDVIAKGLCDERSKTEKDILAWLEAMSREELGPPDSESTVIRRDANKWFARRIAKALYDKSGERTESETLVDKKTTPTR